MPSTVVKYELTKPFGKARHTWTCIGRHAALHLHISGPYGSDGEPRWSAGLETHYRQPPDHMANDAPSHEECWLIGGPCWHDGTSLYAEERYLPRWLDNPHDHDGMFRRLEQEYLSQFPSSRSRTSAGEG